MKITPTKTKRYLYWEKRHRECLAAMKIFGLMDDYPTIVERIKHIAARLNYMNMKQCARIARRCRFKEFQNVKAAGPAEEEEFARTGGVLYAHKLSPICDDVRGDIAEERIRENLTRAR